MKLAVSGKTKTAHEKRMVTVFARALQREGSREAEICFGDGVEVEANELVWRRNY